MAATEPESGLKPAKTPLSAVTDAPDRQHFSASMQMEHWLRLLVAISTLLLLALTVGVAVKLLSYIGHTLLIFSLGGLLAYALDPVIEWARGPENSGRRRVSRTRTTLVVFLGIFAVFVLIVLALSRPLTRQVATLTGEHGHYEEDARAKLADADAWLESHGIRLSLQSYVTHPPPNMKSWGEEISKNVLSIVEHVGKDIVEGFIVGLVALYFLIYCGQMRASVLKSMPEKILPYVQFWMEDVNGILGGFVRGQLTLALTIGAMAAVLCLLMGIKLWLLIGLFVVIAALIPVVGPFIGAVPAVIAALVSPHAHFSPVLRVVVLLAAFGIINEVGSKILYPRLVGAALGLHEVLVLFILFAGVEVAGLTGVLFAAPLTALSVVTLTHLYRLWQGLPPLSVAQAAAESGKRARAHPVM